MRLITALLIFIVIFLICSFITYIVKKQKSIKDISSGAIILIGAISSIIGMISFITGWNFQDMIILEDKHIVWIDREFGKMISSAINTPIDEIYARDLENIECLYIFGDDNNNVFIKDIPFVISESQLNGQQYSFNTQGRIKNLDDISNFPSLKKLTIYGNRIESIKPLSLCSSLEFLCLSNNNITSLEGLESLYKLSDIQIPENKIRDISFISNNDQIKRIDLSYNKIDELNVIKANSKLDTLLLNGNFLSDISFLTNYPNIKYLYLSNNRIFDISQIKKLNNLEKLDISYNHVNEIPELSNISNISFLSLSYNHITNISPLEQLNQDCLLYILKNPISDYKPISHLSTIHMENPLINFEVDNVDNQLFIKVNSIYGTESIQYRWIDINGKHFGETTIFNVDKILLEIPSEAKGVVLYSSDLKKNMSKSNKENKPEWTVFNFD